MKKKLVILGAAALTAAAAIPALAFENEFHGMYKFFAYQSNFFNGTTFNKADADKILSSNAHSGFMAEQRARLQYIAKASDDLKLVTHFELDSRFGGKNEPYLGTAGGNDAGNLDADQLTLETKNVYLDFNCPITGTNVKAGIQPWADAYQSVFLLADMAGVYATKKFGPATTSLGWFRIDDNTAKTQINPGDLTVDLIVADGKYALNKDVTVGVSYYNIQNDANVAQAGGDKFELLHMLGVNADLKFGPATIKPFLAYQFGEENNANDISAFAGGVVTKTKVGAGAVNFSAVYLSGDDNGTGKNKDFKNIAAANAQYFNPANMWLLVRSGQAVNSSASVLGNDLTVGDRGFIGFFAGYEGTVGKVFYNANLGYAMTAEERGTEDSALGAEINAQVGYKLYDNLSASVAGAYLSLGDGLSGSATQKISGFGAVDADDVYMTNVQLSYNF